MCVARDKEQGRGGSSVCKEQHSGHFVAWSLTPKTASWGDLTVSPDSDSPGETDG